MTIAKIIGFQVGDKVTIADESSRHFWEQSTQIGTTVEIVTWRLGTLTIEVAWPHGHNTTLYESDLKLV